MYLINQLLLKLDNNIILMLKKTKKQRRSIAFNTIQMIPDVKDISYNNSSSIIAIDQH